MRVLVLKNKIVYCRVMSISNHLCRETLPEVHSAYWVPIHPSYPIVNFHTGVGFPGVKGILNKAKHIVKTFVKGGSAEEHRLYDLLQRALKDNAQNLTKYAQTGVAEAHLNQLQSIIIAYEAEYHRVHGQPLPPPPMPLPSAPPYYSARVFFPVYYTFPPTLSSNR
jgi:hypothetical protein